MASDSVTDPFVEFKDEEYCLDLMGMDFNSGTQERPRWYFSI